MRASADLDLELAGTTYNNDELRRSEADCQADNGVFAYENTGHAQPPQRLTRNSQALATDPGIFVWFSPFFR